VRDKKQLEWEEEHALISKIFNKISKIISDSENQFAITLGIDDGDADFLSQVDRIKEEHEARKRNEERELLRLAKEQSVIRAPDPAQDRLDRPQRAAPTLAAFSKNTNKQANLVSSLLVRKR